MTAWKVYLNGKHIDTVFFINSMSEAEVLLQLINRDGYDPMIRIKS